MTLIEMRQELKRFLKEKEEERLSNPFLLVENISEEIEDLRGIINTEQNPEVVLQSKGRIAEELADVVIYCLALARTLGIDIDEAIHEKVKGTV